MSSFIEGTFVLASKGSSMLSVDDRRICIPNGEAVQLYYEGQWISGIHIYGDIINYAGKDRLRLGDRIRMKIKNVIFSMPV